MKKIIIILLSIFFLFSCMTLKKSLPDNNAIKVEVLDSDINSDFEDYSPCLLPNGTDFLFVTNRKGSLFNDMVKEYSHDIWIAIKQDVYDSIFTVFSLPNNTEEEEDKPAFNTKLNEGGMCFSSDFKKIYFTGCNREDSYGHCDIYEADINFIDKIVQISNIKNLGPNINSNKWETMPSISPDNKTIYFISNRIPKPKEPQYYYDSYVKRDYEFTYKTENYDIYTSNYDESKNQWLPATKMTTMINSYNSEFSPLICADNKTLIFASTAHQPNGGGLDLYFSKRDSTGNWSKPMNFGKPLNSEYDDFCLTLSADGETGYFSSKRAKSNLDIFKVTMTSILDEVRIISWRQNNTSDVSIVINNNTGTQVNLIKRLAFSAGVHSFEWDGNDDNGIKLKPGKYYFQVFIGDEPIGFKRLLLLKK